MDTPPPIGLEPPDRPNESAHRVALTRWSVVGRAAGTSPSPSRELAREQICRGYWYPLYVFLRRKGHSAETAEEHVQGFFLEVFEKNLLAVADPGRGKFRTFLLTTLERYVAHRVREANTLKRGGSIDIHLFGTGDAERRYADFPSRELSAEAAFDRAWAIAVLENVLAELESEYQATPETFAALRPYLIADGETRPYREVATELGTTPLNVKVMVHRIRARYRKLLDETLRATVEHEGDLEEEREALLRALCLPT